MGVLLGVLGTVLTPWVKHIAPQPGRLKRVEATAERTRLDHNRFIIQKNGELKAELQRIDEELAGRNILESSIRGTRHTEARNRNNEAIDIHGKEALREAQDALAELGPIERWRMKRHHPSFPSIEQRQFGPPEE